MTLNAFKLVLGAAIVSIVATSSAAQSQAPLDDYIIAEFGDQPNIPSSPLSTDTQNAINIAFVEAMSAGWGQDQSIALTEVADTGDPRLAWMVADLLRFVSSPRLNEELTAAASKLLGKPFSPVNSWGVVTDHLIAWDIPAPPDYLRVKRSIFTAIVPQWEPLFVDGDIDWRHVSWGGVLIDDRPFNTTDEPCNCIPAADNPTVANAEDATWLADDAIVFGVEVNGEARAYPRRIMEVREMVNDTLGGRDLGIPYCTLCGAAQAYFTDQLPAGVDRPILRTSGMLIRSNKVMYDLTTMSVFDTFLGKAVTGPLHAKGIELEQAAVVTTTWGQWKAAHPNTTVLTEDLALGRDFDFRNNRDADGPIFPVGDIDPRLPVHEDIIGIVAASGTPIAFPRSAAQVALSKGQKITFENVELVLDAGGIKAVDANGENLGSHQAFWFAWSQFHPDTQLWMP